MYQPCFLVQLLSLSVRYRFAKFGLLAQKSVKSSAINDLCQARERTEYTTKANVFMSQSIESQAFTRGLAQALQEEKG